MTRNEWDGRIDREIERRRSQVESSPDASESLSPMSVAERQTLADALWLDEQVRAMPRPSCDLAHRVVSTLRRQTTETVRSSRIGRFAAALSALAAAIVLVVIVWPRHQPQAPGTTASTEDGTPSKVENVDGVDVARTVRQGTAAYVELVQSLASSASIPTEVTSEPTHPQEVQLASISPVGRAIQGSTRTIQTAGEELRLSVEPITESALDAFGFLWKPVGPSRIDPST